MATTSKVKLTEGAGINAATYSFSEDAVTKDVSRAVLNNSAGTEAGVAALPLQVSLANHAANSIAVKVDASSVAVPVTDNSGSLTVDNAGTFAVQAAGTTASGSSLTSSPVTTGGLAKTANPTAVTDGQVVNNLHDKLGKQVVVNSIRDLKGVQNTTITTSTSETTIVTAVASTFLDLYGLILTNSSGTGTNVTIKDSTSGTTRATIYVPAGDTRGFMLTESAAIPQATVNTNWTATSSASITSLFVAALYVKNL